MGSRILHCGGPGLGQTAKLCNNLVLGATTAATAKAFALAERLRLADQALSDAAAVSSGQSWSLTSYCSVPWPVPASPANRGYDAGLMVKDLWLAIAAAERAVAVTPLCGASARLYAL